MVIYIVDNCVLLEVMWIIWSYVFVEVKMLSMSVSFQLLDFFYNMTSFLIEYLLRSLLLSWIYHHTTYIIFCFRFFFDIYSLKIFLLLLMCRLWREKHVQRYCQSVEIHHWSAGEFVFFTSCTVTITCILKLHMYLAMFLSPSLMMLTITFVQSFLCSLGEEISLPEVSSQLTF